MWWLPMIKQLRLFGKLWRFWKIDFKFPFIIQLRIELFIELTFYDTQWSQQLSVPFIKYQRENWNAIYVNHLGIFTFDYNGMKIDFDRLLKLQTLRRNAQCTLQHTGLGYTNGYYCTWLLSVCVCVWEVEQKNPIFV